MASVRTTLGMLVVLTLTGCAAERASLETAPAPKELSIPGRWILTAPVYPHVDSNSAALPAVVLDQLRLTADALETST